MHEYEEPNAVQIRIALDEIDPPVWRQLIVPLSLNLRQLHLIIQAAFGWHESHLHEFIIGGLSYGDADFLNAEGLMGDSLFFEQTNVTLNDFSNKPGLASSGITFKYVYDFGDHWVHTVTLETRTLFEPLPRIATCLAGARACPPEDVGGIGGYERFVDVIADPVDPEHEDMKRWCGGHFDPEWFDLDLTNKDLAMAFRSSRRRRLRQPKPKRATAGNGKD